MPSTYSSLHYHIFWATKERRRLIEPAWKDRLHAWLGGCVRELDGVALAVNGMPDHVHMLVGLKPVHSIAQLMRVVKGESSEWIHDTLHVPLFEWQEGYTSISVSPSAIAGVRRYVENQEAHHRQESFKEELVALLEKAGIDYDERYL